MSGRELRRALVGARIARSERKSSSCWCGWGVFKLIVGYNDMIKCAIKDDV